MTTGSTVRSNKVEKRLAELGITLPPPPTPFGPYAEAVQTGNLLFLSGMLATAGRHATAVGRIGKELDSQAGQKSARVAALNALAVARAHLGSLDRVIRVVRLGVYLTVAEGNVDHVKVADAASELFRDVLGDQTVSSRLVIGVASLPLGSPVELEVILEVVA
jgi:enamine deaminase RidA (YjgF/YER057c/UK114 family)